MAFEQEAAFEAALINLLTEKYGWEPEILRYKTEEDLIQNWKQILFENNRDVDRLNDVPLTDGEMQQILGQITRLRTPLKLNGFINGKTVAVKRDNPADELHFGKEVSLKIYDRQEIAAGQSRYQIAEQPVFKARNSVLPNRRGDFMLLINGMPLIHCELKRSGVDVSQATNQIEKYAHEGVFTGLFALVQIFIAMQPDETVYFANPGPDGKFNKDFYFHWADANNEPLNNWKDIAQYLLSIPMAHQLIGFYTVADDTDGILKVMRSYQYYATSRITSRVAMRRWADRDQMGGYIWHTTGSGKTLTSFKSAQLIAASKDADKVVFLMDRVELGTQSLLDYRGFADDTDSVQATENTDILVAKLRSDDPANTLIVTSIQKMSRVEEENGFNAHDIELIQNKRVVFIIDEAHRDVFGEMLRTIKETFPNAMFFGFTGTPIHDENQKKMSTTSDVFGNELHRYSIADGIRDKNVLGFDPYMVLTYKDRDLRKAVALERAKATTEAEALADPKKKKVYLHYMDHTKVPMAGYVQADGSYLKGIEDYLPVSQYEREEHQCAVVDDILENWTTLSHDSKFHAIFATSSIPEAIQYYKLFKAKGNLKITALFDPSIDNNGNGLFKEEGIVEIIKDYNTRYSMEFQMATYATFKKDISYRLARKEQYKGIEHTPDQQIDLLIVVDQMLTGFDSKWINTLYLILALRYKELFASGSGEAGVEDVPYEIDSYLTEINTGVIDANYMNSRFKKYIKALQDGTETAAVLDELHKSFATLTQEEQKYANIFLHDVQNGDVIVDEGKTLRNYITEYMTSAKNDQIHRFATAIGVDETILRSFMQSKITEANINEFGKFDTLKATVDTEKAKTFLEMIEGKPIKKFQINMKIDQMLRRFILEGGFDIT